MKLNNWYISRPHAFNPYSAPEVVGMVVNGEVFGNPLFKDGEFVTTSKVEKLEDGKVYTRNSVYELGDIDSEYLKAFPSAIDLIKPKRKVVNVTPNKDTIHGTQSYSVDIANPEKGVQIRVSGDKVWVNVDGVCMLRAYGCPVIEVDHE